MRGALVRAWPWLPCQARAIQRRLRGKHCAVDKLSVHAEEPSSINQRAVGDALCPALRLRPGCEIIAPCS